MVFRVVFSSLLLLGSAAAFSPAMLYQRSSTLLRMGKVVVELDKVTGLQDKDRLGTSDPYVGFCKDLCAAAQQRYYYYHISSHE
jgi:hypothetical protein